MSARRKPTRGSSVEKPVKTEPGYGVLKGPGVLDASVEWNGKGNGESIEIPLKRKVHVDGLVYYVAHIPFETREVVGIDNLSATENVFGLSREDKVYSLVVKIDRGIVPLSEESVQFTYGVCAKAAMVSTRSFLFNLSRDPIWRY